MGEEDLKYGDLTRKIIACAIRVHQELGSGFQEVIYQRAMEIELRLAGIAFHREFVMEVYYRNIRIGTRRVDFLVEDLISVEFKARTQIENGNLAQAMNYLEVYNLEIGMLFNFGEPKLRFHRFTNKKYDPNKPMRRH